MPAARYYMQRYASTMDVLGLSVPGQKLADFSELHPIFALHLRSAPVASA